MASGFPRSVADVVDVVRIDGPGADPSAPPDLLIEVPHGATTEAQFRTVRERLAGRLPEDLETFFFVNTDVGAPECALRTAEMFAGTAPAPGLEEGPKAESRPGAPPREGVPAQACRSAVVLRCLVPRTLVDVNRELTHAPERIDASGMTPAIPSYVESTDDRRLLAGLHETYQEVARRAYERVCGHGGRAVILHTYAPREVQIEVIDHGIVEALRRAYEPGTYERWRLRPDVDLITEAADGAKLAPADTVSALRDLYRRSGIEVTENDTYRLHEATLGYTHSLAWPGRVLCLEISRALLADPFSPFEEMRIGPEKVRRLAGPLAAALGATARAGGRETL